MMTIQLSSHVPHRSSPGDFLQRRPAEGVQRVTYLGKCPSMHVTRRARKRCYRSRCRRGKDQPALRAYPERTARKLRTRGLRLCSRLGPINGRNSSRTWQSKFTHEIPAAARTAKQNMGALILRFREMHWLTGYSNQCNTSPSRWNCERQAYQCSRP